MGRPHKLLIMLQSTYNGLLKTNKFTFNSRPKISVARQGDMIVECRNSLWGKLPKSSLSRHIVGIYCIPEELSTFVAFGWQCSSMFPMPDSYLIYGLEFVTQVYSAYFSDLYGFLATLTKLNMTLNKNILRKPASLRGLQNVRKSI